MKKLDPDPTALLRLVEGWRDDTLKVGRMITRIVLAFEAGRDRFWLARWLRARSIEAFVIHSTSFAVSREHRRAKTDRLDTEMLIRVFLGWLRGEPRHCKMVAIPTLEEEDARRGTAPSVRALPHASGWPSAKLSSCRCRTSMWCTRCRRQSSDIAYQNKAVIYDLLFKASAETTLTIAADPKHLGARIGFMSVLHTWGSALTHHPHVHMIVPGGGLSPDGSKWTMGCSPPATDPETLRTRASCSPCRRAQKEPETTEAALEQPRALPRPCPCCGSRMIIIETFARGCEPKYRPLAAGSNQDRHVMMPSPLIYTYRSARHSCQLSAGTAQARITPLHSIAVARPILSFYPQIARSHRRMRPCSAASRLRRPLQSNLCKPEPAAKSP